MPLYEYECEKCGGKQDIRHSAEDEVMNRERFHKTLPPDCGGKLKRIISNIGNISFRGKGWTPKFYGR